MVLFILLRIWSLSLLIVTWLCDCTFSKFFNDFLFRFYILNRWFILIVILVVLLYRTSQFRFLLLLQWLCNWTVDRVNCLIYDFFRCCLRLRLFSLRSWCIFLNWLHLKAVCFRTHNQQVLIDLEVKMSSRAISACFIWAFSHFNCEQFVFLLWNVLCWGHI